MWTLAAFLGADLSPSPHGVLTVEGRREALTVGLYTDTLQLRWDPGWERGRAWLAVRGEAGVAGMFPSPWVDGAPVEGFLASYAGVEGGAQRYLRDGLYVGLEGHARYWLLEELPDRPVVRNQAMFGFWSSTVRAEARVGLDLNGSELSPHLWGSLRARPDRPVGPRLELQGVVADNQDEVLKTRIGGLNPHVVPLAGAGWGEFWVEDYVATRAGMGWRGEGIRVDLLADMVTFDGRTATGLALDGGFQRGRWGVDAAFGYSPWIHRAEGVAPWTAWVHLGRGHPA